MTDFKLVQAPATPYLYVTRSCSMDPQDISRHMATAFKEVWAFLEAKAIQPAEAIAVYHDYHPDRLDFRAGCIIAPQDASKAEGEVKADVIPAADVIYFQHKGAYATLRDDYALMMQHVARLGREIGAPTWEVYLNDPAQVAEAELLTDVYSTLK